MREREIKVIDGHKYQCNMMSVREAHQTFTERNAGRSTSIEVDDPSIGAQRQETDLELRGVAYVIAQNLVNFKIWFLFP